MQKLLTISDILKTGQDPICSILGKFQSEKDAFNLERDCILKLGRMVDESGTLTNLSVGGEGISSHIEYTNDCRQRQSNRMLGKNNPMFSRRHTEESKKKMSDTTLERLRSGDIVPNHHTSEYKHQLSEDSRLGTLAAKMVCQLCPDTKKLRTFKSTAEAGRKIGITSWRNISVVCNKHPTRKVGGYFWMWKN